MANECLCFKSTWFSRMLGSRDVLCTGIHTDFNIVYSSNRSETLNLRV